MDIEYIKNKWINRTDKDIEAGIRGWNSVVDEYIYSDDTRLDRNPFLIYLQKKVPLSDDMSVLDVGCGAGAYSIALAEKVGKVTGIDYSPKMIEAAISSASQMGIHNVEFMVCNWYDCSDHSFDGKFDFVFAHTTAAIADYNTFVKMINASKTYGILCETARRTDDVYDEICKIAGIGANKDDAHVAYAFDTLWGRGLNPEIDYIDTVWKSSLPVGEAEAWYLGKLKTNSEIDNAVTGKICEFLRSISKDGMVEETISTKLVNLFWKA